MLRKKSFFFWWRPSFFWLRSRASTMICVDEILSSSHPHSHSRTAESSAAASKAREARRPWMTLPAREASIVFFSTVIERKKRKINGMDQPRRAAPHFSLFWKSRRTSQLVSFPHRSLCSLSFLLLFSSQRHGPLIPRRPRRAGKSAVFLLVFFLFFFDRNNGNRRESRCGRGRTRRPLGDARVRASLRRLDHLVGAGKKNESRRSGEREKREREKN